MSVLFQVQKISKKYGARTLLDDVTVSFARRQKIGVIGRNGCGKSTLCKIITGEDEADSGTITTSVDLRLSYLEQHDPYKEEELVSDFLTRYTKREEWECGEMAAKFEIDYDMLYAPIKNLSGGYRTRVKLAAMLLREPNFLILDEPTNYLDLSTLIILENFLQTFNGGFLIVSHDREFLKKTCEHTLEIDQGKATLFPGGVEDYFEFKEEDLRQKLAFNQNVEKKKEQLQRFVDRFRAKASKATAAKSKMKQIDKLETIDIAHTASSVRINIPKIEAKAGIALDCQDLAIGYPGNVVADKIHCEIDRGDRIAILGNNGEGKTTFMRTIVGGLDTKGGEFRWGTGLTLGYYAQHVFASLHAEDTILSHLQRAAADGTTLQEVLNMAGSFLFKGDDTEKKVGVLSGGERARLILAGLLLSKNDVLLLDEPTNHLDFETVEALGRALRGFNGTVFFISHDRTFVNLVATGILEVGGGKIEKYPGTYEDYVYHLEVKYGGAAPAESKSDEDKKVKKQAEQDLKDKEAKSKKQSAEEDLKRKEVKKELTKLKVKSNKLESRLERLQDDQEKILAEIAENPFNYSKEREEKKREIEINIEDTEAEWLKLQSEIEKLQKKIKW